MDVVTMSRRVENGTMTQEQKDKIQAERQQNRISKTKKYLRERYSKQYKETWERPRRSLIATKNLIGVLISQAYQTQDAERIRWLEDCQRVIYDAAGELINRRGREPCPVEGALFWYDISAEWAHTARRLVAEYPGDPEECPIKVM